MASVSIRGVTKHFGATTVIPGVDLQIADGEFVTLVGPSGCGKSTLLRMIAGLEGVSGGEIAIAGERVNETPPMHRDVAMVFQSYALYPHMDVERNMSFGLRLRHVVADVIAQKVDQAAVMLNLRTLLARLPSQLSGGQRQRVAMGRAMVRQPRVFLFDEPLSNLDAKLRVQMRTEIKALHKRLATTSIYVTHDQIEAMTMADRIVVMNGGQIEQVGTPEALYDAPDNLFVAGFIGSPAMNFLAGTGDRDGSIRTTAGDRLPAPIPLASGQRVTLGIRPEHIRLAAAGEQGVMQVAVISVEPTGADTHIVCSAGDDTITVSVRDRVKAQAGQTVPIAFDTHKVHCFDPESGATLRR